MSGTPPPALDGTKGLPFRLAVVGAALAAGVALLAGLSVALLPLESRALQGLILLAAGAVAAATGALAGRRTGRSLARPLADLNEALRSGAVDALPVLPVGAPGEIGETARGVAAVTRAYLLAREDLAAAAGRVHAESGAIHEAASRRSSLSQAEAASINQTNDAAVEIARETLHALEQADSVIEMGRRSEEMSAHGARMVAGVVEATGNLAEHVRRVIGLVGELSERTSQIAEIVVTVQDLAEQTDLVALNASVEAAKAGEQGRGFAVVAMEMRQLAEQSRQAATQVRAILAEIDRGTQVSANASEEGAARAQEALQLARSAGETIDALAAVIRSSAGAAREIAEAARRQTHDVQSMVSSFGEVVRALDAGAGDTRDLERSAKALADLSRALAERAAGARLAPGAEALA